MTSILKKITAATLALSMLTLWSCAPNEGSPSDTGTGTVGGTDTVSESADAESTTADTSVETDVPETENGGDAEKDDEEEVVDKTNMVFGEAGELGSYNADEANYELNIDASAGMYDISDLLFGIFFEDINFAADGGLYAEMVQNRSFEFTKYAAGDELHAWSSVGTVTKEVIKNDPSGALNANNPNYVVITNESGEPAGIANKGFLDGMAVKKDASYIFTVYARGIDGYEGPVYVSITAGKNVLAEGKIDSVGSDWQKHSLTLTTSSTSAMNVKLNVTIDEGKAAFDMVSLFPEDTYKGRENGLRRDLAEKLEALEPAFLRFPGGCIIEGMTLGTAYNWKDSVGADKNGDPYLFGGTYGDVAARKQGVNLWTNESLTNDQNPCYMSYGLGFYEYFLLAEDIGAIGVPVLNCGVACQGQSNGHASTIGSAECNKFIQDALDLVEFCRGGVDTEWGAVRAAMGHEEPFELKYIGIGNEQWGTSYYTHYEAFVKAFEEAKADNPELFEGIELMYSAGVDDGDSGFHYYDAYKNTKSWLGRHPDKTVLDYAGAIDHHYYNDPEWFLANADYYDPENYSREELTDTIFGGAIPVFLGEYAARSNQLKAALAEAAYMTGLERNGDIVRMAAYAPLFGNLTGLHWAPDLIWFNNRTSTASTNYYVQKIFSTNVGTSVLNSELIGADIDVEAFEGKIGVGTWSTVAKFDNVRIVDNDTGKVLGEDTFDGKDSLDDWQKVTDGNWSIKNGQLYQSSGTTNTDLFGDNGTVMYFGKRNWKNYTFTVDATKVSGAEGFLIPFAVNSKENNYFWNIGGWGNSISCLQRVENGTKTNQLVGTEKNVTIATNKTYQLKVVVNGYNVKCYINDKLYVDYTIRDNAEATSYQVVSTDETGDIIIKLVNVTGKAKTFAIDISGTHGTVSSTASVDLVAGTSLTNDNILGEKEDVTMESYELDGVSERFNYTAHKYSVTVLRIHVN